MLEAKDNDCVDMVFPFHATVVDRCSILADASMTN